MAQYHFHLHDCGSRVEDEEGSAFPDQASARQHAIAGARDIIAADVLTGRLCLGSHIEVENRDTGECVDVRFLEAVTVTGL